MKNFNLCGFEISIKKNDSKNKLSNDIDTNYYRSIPSLTEAITLKAHKETMEYIQHNIDLSSIILCDNRWNNILTALKYARNNEGLYLEFGVHTGRSINYIAQRINRTIYGFDSFEGLPNDWKGFNMQSGHFDIKGRIPSVERNVILYKGWFDKTIPLFLKQTNENIAFLHVDCDIYESARIVLNKLAHRMQAGTVIVFDEFFNYPNWQNHEFRAFQEFIEEYKFKFEYISFGKLQVAIKITDIGENE